ncbi:DUF805 domain-containing protein [Phocoenobacter skyensis]|uniref:DUF805 domain-containing protein n=1 Tax=Phocoenobacter skyensis TaxID=97481 RepID=A0A1H7VHB1_9PAST|nr:DUF805 domain-containing protein [Pasteurella skyensis]MDP8079340.1 DUF805 domain-containing protein [Pasteurella skyensis]MDP8085212.1 DUF805 domain-containing protein [Pasteurella skyensis]MDP8162667.1 DUF805 domain-containing protein [Pasteurella skyensis]MDP8171403.1 DUF805 domain-containing protein [Pasteurella skyensis]MDP8173435.1 DUF805 domain-containing protein [Pasteurella skyensis]
MIWYHALFSLQGRLNRQGFWIGIGLNFAFLLIVANLLGDFSTMPLIGFAPLLISLYSIITVIIKRLHDRNRSAKSISILLVPVLCYFASLTTEGKMAWALGVVMPVFIATTLLLEWGCFKSFPESNEYGEQGLSVTLTK